MSIRQRALTPKDVFCEDPRHRLSHLQHMSSDPEVNAAQSQIDSPQTCELCRRTGRGKRLVQTHLREGYWVTLVAVDEAKQVRLAPEDWRLAVEAYQLSKGVPLGR